MKMNEIEDMDFLKLSKTEEYARLASKLSLSTNVDYAIFGDRVLTLKGDVSIILIHRDGSISLGVIYDFDSRIGERMATVNVSDKSLIETVRRSLKTSRSVRLKVKCAMEGVKTFDLVSIEEMNQKPRFPVYVCSECGHSYGYRKPESKSCIICETPFKFEDTNFF